jgi:hypothetical protein
MRPATTGDRVHDVALPKHSRSSHLVGGPRRQRESFARSHFSFFNSHLMLASGCLLACHIYCFLATRARSESAEKRPSHNNNFWLSLMQMMRARGATLLPLLSTSTQLSSLSASDGGTLSPARALQHAREGPLALALSLHSHITAPQPRRAAAACGGLLYAIQYQYNTIHRSMQY